MTIIDSLPKYNLIEEFENSLDKERILAGIENLKLSSHHPKYKIGQIIEFTSGYNNDMRYTSRVTGFDNDLDIYVLWDCYWYPIRDCIEREIKIIE